MAGAGTRLHAGDELPGARHRSTRRAHRGVALGAVVLLWACGGGSDGRRGLAAPSGLSYPSPYAVAVGTPFAPLTPSVVGQVSEYAVSPALPAGITLDPASGQISGTPASIGPAARYTLTARNGAGTTRFDWVLSVVELTPAAGADQTVRLGDFVTLDGSASSSSTGAPVRYEWTLEEAPSGSEALPTSPASARPVFLADRVGTFVAALRVRDGTALSGAARVTVSVQPREARVVEPPAAGSTPVASCREIVAPGDYVLVADLVSGDQATPCLYIHDTSDVVLHCQGHQLSDAVDRRTVALELRNVQRVVLRACRVETESLRVEDARDVLLTDSDLRHRLGLLGQPAIRVARGERFEARHNVFTDVGLRVRLMSHVVIADNDFLKTRGDPAEPGVHAEVSQAADVQVLRNRFDGGWDGAPFVPPLPPSGELDDAIVLSDVSEVVVRHNVMRNYFDVGVEWVGWLDRVFVEENVAVNMGLAGFGGWYWASVSASEFNRNLVLRSASLFLAFRTHGLRPAGWDGGAAPADPPVLFRDNRFDGNVQRAQVLETYTGSPVEWASWMPVTERMAYNGGLSTVPGERAPADSEFQVIGNVFTRNDFGAVRPGPQFGVLPFTDEVVDGGENRCRMPAGRYALSCSASGER